MKVEILYFEGCPNHVSAMEMVQQVLGRERIEAQIVSLDVPDVETAKKIRFLGSPSIRVNGRDIEPRERERHRTGSRRRSTVLRLQNV